MSRLIRKLYRIAGTYRVPLTRGERFAPCFIVGSGRSGTTLLRRILVATEQIAIPPESWVLTQVVSAHQANPRLGWNDLVLHCIASFEYGSGFGSLEIDYRTTVGRLLDLPPDEHSVTRIVDAVYRAAAAASGMTNMRWGDKTPMYVLHMDMISELFVDVKFIHMVRDPVDTVASMLSMGKKYTVASAALRWCEALDCFERYAARHRERCLTLWYQDLVAAPESEAQRVARFLGITIDTEALVNTDVVSRMGDAHILDHLQNSSNPISTASVGRGRATLSTSQIEEIASIVGDRYETPGA